MLTKFMGVLGASLVIALPAYAAVTYPPSAFKEGAIKCMRTRSYDCAEKNWTQYIKMRPTDSEAVAILAVTFNWDDKPEASIVQAEKAIDMGEGSYDLFAAYAQSLAKVGRVDEAIDWSYKTLAVVSNLVNVRGDLAKLLVMRKRDFEALALLTSFDATLEGQGHPNYFEGQRISIESSLERRGIASANTASGSQKGLRLSKTGDHFYAPVKVGESKYTAFIVDTGASKTVLSEDMLANSKASYKVLQPKVTVQLADGRRSTARLVALDSMKVGPYELQHVPLFVCKDCVSLLGQASLSQFNMVSSKTQGVEFLTLEQRTLH